MICISVHTFLLLPDNRVRTHSDQAARVAITSPEIIWSIYRLPLGGWDSVWGLLFVCIFIKDLLCLMIWEEKLVLRNKIRNFYIHYSSFCQKIFLISVSNERVLNRTVMGGEKWRPHCIIPFFNCNSFWWIMIWPIPYVPPTEKRIHNGYSYSYCFISSNVFFLYTM